ncbi:hypothetical protein [uncultured Gimesia sp.]|jgi:hypothetical protein|uniref:hypothetical protein n=1 Tax=uncultured Gimesia sp. TaxID=1678688 RepID=UPI002626FD02|nr:hypothetical protein [uncultured Gimesia sp.]
MIHYWGNVVEGLLWIVIAGIICFRSRALADQKQKLIAKRAMIAFFCFGISDFIEVYTGAWYRPIGLLLLKAACMLTLAHCLFKHYALKRENQESGPVDGEESL